MKSLLEEPESQDIVIAVRPAVPPAPSIASGQPDVAVPPSKAAGAAKPLDQTLRAMFALRNGFVGEAWS
jgi:hypothetical protein